MKDEDYTVGDGQTGPVDPGKDPGSPDQPGNDDKPGDESDIPSTGVGLPLAGLSIVCLSGIAVMLLYRRRRHIR